MNIDWSKAPEGATHFLPAKDDLHRDIFLIIDGGIVLKVGYPGISEWCLSYRHGNQPSIDIRHAIARHEAWNGEGLPPVGTVCEYYADEDTWRRCEIVAHKDGMAVVWVNRAHIWAGSGAGLRPIRTPEQVEAEEREKAIEEMWKVYWQPDAPTAKQALGLLYDAGYRKQEQTK